MKKSIGLVLMLGVFALPLAASATLVDFEDLNNNGTGGFTLYGDTVVSNGYQFKSVLHTGDSAAIASWTTDIGSYYTGSVAIFANYFDDSLDMTQVGGGAFNLTSIDMCDVFRSQENQTVVFTGYHADNTTVQQSFFLADGANMHTFSFSGMTNLVRVNINDDTSIDTQLDNIVVAPVPEPATMAVLGIGALALIRRRRAK